jgi:hypothetical protein
MVKSTGFVFFVYTLILKQNISSRVSNENKVCYNFIQRHSRHDSVFFLFYFFLLRALNKIDSIPLRLVSDIIR